MSWYHDDSKADGGWSLERINPLAICSGAYNWWASTSESGGTAGSENSVFNTAPNGNPYVIENGVLSASQLYIRFTESMESGSTSNIDPTLDPSNSIQSFTWNSDLDQLILNITVDLLPEQAYSLNITGLTDCDGNPVNPVNLSFLLGVEPQPGDIIINEIMADGSSESQDASPKYDYIELYNKTTHILDLSQINVNDGFFEEQVIIYPDSFIIITDADNDPFAFIEFPTTKFMTDFPSLFESGTTITVLGNNGLLDEVTYNKTYYHDVDKEDGGYSMELINPLDPCSSSDNWHACLNTNGTSAGKRNSVYSTLPDITPPSLQYILGEPQESVTLVFNEPIDEASLAGIEWTVNGVLQTNFNPILSGDEHNMLVLYYGEMEEGIIYQFELSGLSDCWQNMIGLLQDKFGLAETAQAGDIIINEVLYNPFEGGSDFVEIYNNSMRVLSLKDWRIADGTGGFMNNADIITELNYLLFPGEYLALGKTLRHWCNIIPLQQQTDYGMLKALQISVVPMMFFC
ncbi:MAG: lamin tail domain-containing protein [Flavobacteriales bacterium]|nr:lamin tail domain-containing protein [Flavobacteriales bacterium]